MKPTTAVDAEGLVKSFGAFRAVDRIDLEVRQGEIFGVLGPNGAGKTTMLRMLATLVLGGMRRRLDLAASLITRPPLIFLDEPTTGLDPRTRGQMWDTIRSLVADGCTVLLTTQYLDEADQLADRVSVIDRGRKVAEGTPDELKSSVGNSTLQLQLAAGADHDLARRVVRRVVGGEPVLTPESGRMNVPLDASDVAPDVLIALREADVASTCRLLVAFAGSSSPQTSSINSSGRTGRPPPAASAASSARGWSPTTDRPRHRTSSSRLSATVT
jgi:ABC-type multidrug transport system ATPase subunit